MRFASYLIAVSLIVMPGMQSAHAQEPVDNTKPGPPTLTVSGTGESMARPDRATIRLGATAQASDASAAQEQVNEIMTRAIEAIRDLGVKEESISTVGLSLHPVYSDHRPRPMDQPAEPRVVGFRAGNTILVRLDDLELVGDVIDAGVKSGANQIEGLSFELKDQTAARSAALRDAAKQARAKADAIAEAMNLGIVSVMEIQEGGAQLFPRQFDMARVAAMDAAGAPVQPGQVQMTASVTVTYRVAPEGSGSER